MKRILFLLVTLVASTVTWAGPVSKDEAMTKAQAFVSAKSQQLGGPRRVKLAHQQMTLAQTAGDALYYVFNIGEKNGFVFVSGDDRTPAILGYCDDGVFDPNNMPENMRAWLQGYADQLAWLQAHPEAVIQSNEVTREQSDEVSKEQGNDVQGTQPGIVKMPAKAPVKTAISPLVQVNWNQDAPYNNDCPSFFGYESVTGCVATAMAQVISYHQHPAETTKEIPSYQYATTYGGGPLTSAAVPVTSFDWSQLRGSYSTSSSADEQTFIASLMRCCGASVEMQYRNTANGGSGTNDGMVPNALINYFDYSPAAHLETRANYSLAEWNNLIYAELAANRPVFYGGQSSGGGHAFVVDGYDGDELFHVNWGWGGYRNGYFLLSILNPGSTAGIGASTSNDGYSFGQDAVVGIEPNTGQAPVASPQYLTYSFPTFSDSKITFPKVQNNSGQAGSFDLTLAVIDNQGNIVDVEPYYTGQSVRSSYFFTNLPFQIKYLSFAQANGTYKIVPVSCIEGTNEWVTNYQVPNEYILVEVNNGSYTTSYYSTDALTVTDVSCSTNKKANSVQTLDVTVSNTGEEYYGQIYLFASKTSDMGTSLTNAGVTIQKNKSITTSFEFTPTEAGTYNLWFTKDEGGQYVIGTSSVDITAGETGSGNTTNNLDLNFTPDISVLSADQAYILGSVMNVSLAAENPTADNYSGSVMVIFHEYGGGYHRTSSQWFNNVKIDHHSSIILQYSKEDLTPGYEYAIQVQYNKNGVWTTFGSFENTRYIAAESLTTYDNAGNSQILAATANFEIPSGTTAIDLRGNTTTTSVTWSVEENKNCLFFIDDGATVPMGANGNIVEGGVAQLITLEDGHSFYSPIDFIATDINYTRSSGANESLGKGTGKGWTTITLPFDVSSVTVDLTKDNPSYPSDYQLDWFHSSTDKKKNFWVMEFSSETGTTVNFNYADEIKGGRPYLLGIPGSSWGAANNLTGYPITFHGRNVAISGDFRPVISGDNFKMKGTTVTKTLSGNGVYALNADGNAFVKPTASVDVNPFRAYFETTSTASLSKQLTIGFGDDDDETTALGGIQVNSSTVQQFNRSTVYDLSGRKVMSTLPDSETPTLVRKGIYIVNGKKVIIK